MPHVYAAVRSLRDHELVDGGDCVALVKAFAPGLKGYSTLRWRPGDHVVDVATKLAPGTAIATFEKGRYPQRRSGQHAAFFLGSAGSGIWVMDQWKGDRNKPTVSKRHIPKRGQNPDGSYRDPSNNAEAFYVIER